MPTDNHPQLGGDSETNAPMIAGRGTQIAVSVRGAYQAGNLDALIGHLSEAQAFEFRRALVLQSIHHLEPRLPSPEHDLGHSAGVHFAHQWLENPTGVDVKRAVIAAVAEAIDGGVRYHDYDEIFLHPIYIIDAADLAHAVRLTLEIAWRGGNWQRLTTAVVDGDHSADTARRWLIETAWAILHDHPTPPLGDAHAAE